MALLEADIWVTNPLVSRRDHKNALPDYDASQARLATIQGESRLRCRNPPDGPKYASAMRWRRPDVSPRDRRFS